MSAIELSDIQVELLTGWVTPPEAHAVLWHFARTPGVLEPGSFVRSLIDTIAKADPGNRRNLSYGFPGYVAAVNLAQGHPDGIARLQQIARVEPVTDEIPVIR